MRWVLAIVSLMLAWPAQAQEFDQSQLIEALRPRMAPRPLTGDERKQAALAVAGLKAAPASGAIARVRPFAEAGDIASMRAILDAYLALEERSKAATSARLPFHLQTLSFSELAILSAGGAPEPVNLLALPEHVYGPLSALWAAAVWRSTGTGEWAVSAAISRCLPPPWLLPVAAKGARINVSARYKAQDCGFDITITSGAKRVEIISKIPTKQRGIVLVEHSVLPVADLRRQRFAVLETHMLAGGQPDTESIRNVDYAWAQQLAWAYPEYSERYHRAAYAFLTGGARKRDQINKDSPMMAYIRADPARLALYNSWPADQEEVYARRRAAFAEENARFDAVIASRNHKPEDRYWMARVGLREGGVRAQQYWRIFALEDPGDLDESWCTAGIYSACENVRMLEFRRKAQSSSGSGYVAPDLAGQMDAFRKHEAAVNSGNCARAAMGANIKCNP